MTKSSLKDIAAQIKKEAVKIPRAPKGYVPGGRGVPHPGGRGTITPATPATGMSSDAVKEMQQAIANFAKTLAAHPLGSMEGQQDRPGSPDYLGGTKPFGNFLVNHYVNNAKIVGKQFVNVDMPEPVRSGSAIPNKDFAGVVRTISHIGSPGMGESKPDGIWQTRTNNALKQIYAVGKSLMQFGKEMGMSISGFYEDDLNELASNIPASYTQLKDPSENARAITPIINKLTNLYKEFEDSVLEHPQLKAIITQDKPFADHSKFVKEELTPDERSFIEAHRDAVIPGVNINGKAVRITDLENTLAFKKFLQGANVDVSKPSEVEKYLSVVKNTIKGTDLGPGF
jgi:hypothetical protein